MAATISLYNQTAQLFASGQNLTTDVYKVMLCTSATFDATNQTLASVTKTETTEANGYSSGGSSLSGVTVSTVTTNDARFDAADVSWTASGGAIAASYAILYNDTSADDRVLAFIDFGGSQSAGDGTDFLIVWNSNGIFTWTVT